MLLLVPVLPLVGFLLNASLGRRLTKQVSGSVACGAILLSFLVSIAAVWQLVSLQPEERSIVQQAFTWITSGDFSVGLTFRLDPLSAVMILVVTGIGSLIHIYSTAYMHDEPDREFATYFAYLNLFAAFMLVLVLGANFLVMFVGWEGVGLCSYLLIGFWFEKPSAADAGKKAFIVNRIGDFGFLLGILLVFVRFGTLDFQEVGHAVAGIGPEAAFGTLSLMTLLLFIGATGKSAQIPLYVWLPDAMEGPTPVSALIHAATMVTAGVYMVGRNAVLFSHAPMVMEIVAIIGVLTALMAASIGLVQNDIKRVLAYSTVSQLGYMFTGMGVGAFSAGAFHLMTHAFFKALLFLGSGSVIHAMAGEQDMRHMGGLRKYMPVTFVTMLIGTLAIAGIPPLSGFFSKDEILFRAFVANRAIWVLAVATAMMTAFYMFRLMAMTFFGPYRGPKWETEGHHDHAVAGGHGSHGASDQHGHGPWHGPHESPRPMTFPLQALAVGAIVAGFVGVPAAIGGSNEIEHFLEPSFTAEHASVAGGGEAGRPLEAAGHEGAGAGESSVSAGVEIGLMAFSVAVALAGIGIAWKFYVTSPDISEQLAERLSGAHRTLSNKYYVDELYNATVVAGTFGAARRFWSFDRTVVDGAVNGTSWVTIVGAWFSGLTDRTVVDGLVNLIGWIVQESSHAFRRVQTGLVQNYAMLIVFGVFVFVTAYLFIR